MNKKIYVFLYKFMKFINKTIDFILLSVVVLVLCYGMYGLYDTQNVMSGTSYK